MSIKFLTRSFEEHRTVDSITVTTMYQMTWEDYYNGVGDLVDGNNDLITTDFYLPWEGDNFGIYYSTSYLSDCVLTDISMEATDSVIEAFDSTLQDLDREIVVVYTWSNDGDSDTKRLNEASSWKIRYETTMETITLDAYIDSIGETGSVRYWPNQYYTELNPDIKGTKTGSDGKKVAVNYGKYNDNDEALQNLFIDATRDRIPEIIVRVPKTTCIITTYGSFVQGNKLAQLVGTVNDRDFLQYVYQQKEAALSAKNKQASYTDNDWIGGDDNGQWLFVDWDMEDTGNGFFEYTFYFEFDKEGWNAYADAEIGIIYLDIYKEADFYNQILLGMDEARPNDRGSR